MECTGIDLNRYGYLLNLHSASKIHQPYRNWGYKWRPVTYGDVDLSSDEDNSWEGEADLKKKKHKKPKPVPRPTGEPGEIRSSQRLKA